MILLAIVADVGLALTGRAAHAVVAARRPLMEVIAWFTDPANWSGTSGIPNRVVEHIELSVLAILIGCLIAIPVGLFIGHTGRGAAPRWRSATSAGRSRRTRCS